MSRLRDPGPAARGEGRRGPRHAPHPQDDVNHELPSSAPRHPARYLLHPVRPVARRVFSSRWDVRVHDADLVPASGPVIFASNHVGVLDGPLLAIYMPRPVHALTKSEMFEHRALGRFLLASGQIPLHRFEVDPRAVRTCLRVLRDGGAVGIFPEGARGAGDFERFHRGAAYLAMVSGAPVVPVVQIGTRVPGGTMGSMPPAGSVLDLVVGPSFHLDQQPWPRTRDQVEKASLLLQQHLRAHLASALGRTGRALPGPLPVPDPDPPALDEEDR